MLALQKYTVWIFLQDERHAKVRTPQGGTWINKSSSFTYNIDCHILASTGCLQNGDTWAVKNKIAFRSSGMQ